MAVTLRVTPTELKKAADDVTSIAKTLRGDFDRLQELVKGTSFYWTGDGGDQYRRSFAERKSETEQLLRAVAKYPTDLMIEAQLYEQSEEKIVSNVSVLKNNVIR